MPEFVPFRFEVNLLMPDSKEVLCRGFFSEVSGIELTMEPRVISEGGRNWGDINRAGQTHFSPIVLKRGVTDINDLWSWFDAVTRGGSYGQRLTGTISVLGGQLENGVAKPVLIWTLSGVLPKRFKSPDLSSTAAQVAIEELTLIYESVVLERPKSSESSGTSNNGTSNGTSPGGFGASFSASAGFGL